MSMGTAKHGTDLGFSEIRLKVQETDPRLPDDVADFIAETMAANMSFDKAQEKYDLCGEVVPLCRNSFYKVRRRVLDSLTI